MTTTNPSAVYFEKSAGVWAEPPSGCFTEAVRTAAIRKAYLHPGSTAAAIGAEAGFMALGLALLVQKVHVLDGSPGRLEQVKKDLAKFTSVEFHLVEGLALPLREASLDAAFANMVLQRSPDPFALLQEMVSILRPGGRLVITELDLPGSPGLSAGTTATQPGF